MARADRSFTGEDILRLYCRNLDVREQALVDAVGFNCAELSDDEFVLRLLRIVSTPPFSSVIERFPAGSYILAGIELAIALLSADTSGADAILVKYPGYLYDPGSVPPST